MIDNSYVEVHSTPHGGGLSLFMALADFEAATMIPIKLNLFPLNQK